MSSIPPRFCPGTPAAFCRSFEASIHLQGLVEVLQSDQPVLVWLDSARPHPVTGRFSILGWDPWLTLSASKDALTITTSAGTVRTHGDPFQALRRTLARYPGPRQDVLPPVGVGLLGCLSYELNRWIERLPSPKSKERFAPELLMFGMRMVVVVDHAQGQSWCVSVADPHQPYSKAVCDARTRLEACENLLKSVASAETVGSSSSLPVSLVPQTGARQTVAIDPAPLASRSRELGQSVSESVTKCRTQSLFQRGGVEPTMTRTQFESMVKAAQDYIKAGDIFQANLSQRFEAAWVGSPWPLYLALREINPSPFACFLRCSDFAIVSCSPERLVRVRNGLASARPIAGTRPRGMNPEEDLVNSLELILSDKERAEHIMLVDLARNDLGRVCRFGSVTVDELMTLEDYSHVIHIVSNVRGTLAGHVDTVEVIRAMFPGGTITGCPKVRCMEIIYELEPVARGLYTGSLGYIGFDGSIDLNILIRTIVVQHDRAWFHVGAGIVADSQPDREYDETLAKAGALLHALRRATALAKVDALCP